LSGACDQTHHSDRQEAAAQSPHPPEANAAELVELAACVLVVHVIGHIYSKKQKSSAFASFGLLDLGWVQLL
jgi:hypothetical protein